MGFIEGLSSRVMGLVYPHEYRKRTISGLGKRQKDLLDEIGGAHFFNRLSPVHKFEVVKRSVLSMYKDCANDGPKEAIKYMNVAWRLDDFFKRNQVIQNFVSLPDNYKDADAIRELMFMLSVYCYNCRMVDGWIGGVGNDFTMMYRLGDQSSYVLQQLVDFLPQHKSEYTGTDKYVERASEYLTVVKDRRKLVLSNLSE